MADCEGYVTVGEYEDGRPGEVFIKVSKQGSTLAGIMDAFSISISLGLQHGVPLATFVRKFANMKFEPAGITDDPELRIATSLIDYIFRRLALDYLSVEERSELGILSTQERTQPTLPGRGGDGDALGRAWSTTGPGPTPLPARRASTGDAADWPGRSSATRRSATTAATPCSGPARATCAGAAGRPAGARDVQSRLVTLAQPGLKVGSQPLARGAASSHRFVRGEALAVGGEVADAAQGAWRHGLGLMHRWCICMHMTLGREGPMWPYTRAVYGPKVLT